MGIRRAILDLLAGENRSEHCKFYLEPTVKQAISNFAHREGITFSEAARAAVLNSEEIQHELEFIKELREKSNGSV